MDELDPVIHQPVRLRIMAALMTLDMDAEIEFTTLRDLLNLTDGNLGAHLRKLERAEYVQIHKTFVGRKPRTFLSLTPKGRVAFLEHRRALEALLQSVDRALENNQG